MSVVKKVSELAPEVLGASSKVLDRFLKEVNTLNKIHPLIAISNTELIYHIMYILLHQVELGHNPLGVPWSLLPRPPKIPETIVDPVSGENIVVAPIEIATDTYLDKRQAIAAAFLHQANKMDDLLSKELFESIGGFIGDVVPWNVLKGIISP